MKHLLLIIVVLVVGYVAWSVSDKYARRSASKFITRHGLRLGFMLAVALIMVLAAANLPSTQIL